MGQIAGFQNCEKERRSRKFSAEVKSLEPLRVP